MLGSRVERTRDGEKSGGEVCYVIDDVYCNFDVGLKTRQARKDGLSK